MLLGIILAMNFIDEAFTPVLLPVYCRDILRNPTLIGWLLGADGFGAVLGTLLYLLCGHRLLGLRWVTFISCLALLTTTRLALASLPGLVGASCLLFALGLASGPVNPIINTVVQGITPEALRGRVFGAISSVAYAAAPLGIMAAGWLVALRGLQVALDAFGAFYVVVFLVAWYSTALKNLTRR